MTYRTFFECNTCGAKAPPSDRGGKQGIPVGWFSLFHVPKHGKTVGTHFDTVACLDDYLEKLGSPQ